MEKKKDRKQKIPYHTSKEYKKEAIQAAHDLLYGDEVMNALYKAETNSEIQKIMENARRNKK